MRVIDRDGKVTTLDGKGNVTFSAIRQVEIENLTQVTEHRVAIDGDNTIHSLSFVGGGRCELTFDANGKFAGMNSTLMQIQKTNDDRLILQGTTPPEKRAGNASA